MLRVTQVQAELLRFVGLQHQEPQAVQAAFCTAPCPGHRAARAGVLGCWASGTHTAHPQQRDTSESPSRTGKQWGKEQEECQESDSGQKTGVGPEQLEMDDTGEEDRLVGGEV